MRLGGLTVLLCFVAWRTACEAVVLKPVHTSAIGNSSFCVTVSDQLPANLTREEKINWKSSPTIEVRLYVQVTRLNQYITCASKLQLKKDVLRLGSHLVEYSQDVTDGFMTLAGAVSGAAMKPQNCSEPIYASTARFEEIKVFAKGPLYFNWDGTCPVTTRSSSSATLSFSVYPTTGYSSSRSSRDISKMTINNLQRTSIPVSATSPPATSPPATSPPPLDGITADGITADGITGSHVQVNGLPLWAWIIAAAVLVAVIVVAVSCCYACARRRNHKNQMRRRTGAERVKQQLLVDAKRMSYQEQMRWDMGRVDSGAVQATQEFSYKMTTFSDED